MLHKGYRLFLFKILISFFAVANMTNRYTVQGAQGEFQPGSNDLVQANQLGITSVEEMNELELYLLQQLYEEVLLAQLPNRVVQVADLKT